MYQHIQSAGAFDKILCIGELFEETTSAIYEKIDDFMAAMLYHKTRKDLKPYIPRMF